MLVAVSGSLSAADVNLADYLTAEVDPCFAAVDNHTNWDRAYAVVDANYGTWDSTSTTVTDSSANWNAAYDNVIYNATVEVNNAELLTLYSAPKQLIVQPGSGKLIEVISAVVFLDYGSAALTEPNDLNLQYATSNSAIVAVADTGLLDQTADTLTIAKPATLAGVAASNCVNQAVELANSGTKEYEGATGSALKIYLTYRIRSGM